MARRQCYHCKDWIEEGTPHDCWTTTESALTEELSDDLREAWERLRDTAVEFGDLLRTAEEEFPGSLRVPRPRREASAHPPRRAVLEIEVRAHHSNPAPR
jgi:hypothetical protein